jgi:tetratricopeptide (TPR) repeat protein
LGVHILGGFSPKSRDFELKGDLMRVRSKAILASTAIVAMVALSACGQLANLQARKAFKDANVSYQSQNYVEAAAKYEEVVADPSVAGDPNLVHAYFFLGNSYDNQYKPARRGEPANDDLLTKAIENYKIAVEKETDPKMRKLALDYLVAAYGPDKLDDPTQAEPLVQRMIELDPSETSNYFALANIYENAGNLDEAEAMLNKAREAKPKEAAVYQQLAGFYQRQGDFEKLIAAVHQRAELEPNNPEAHYAVATYYWDESYRNTRLNETQKREYVKNGLTAVDKAIALNPDYIEALTYRGLLLRVEAAMEKDAARQKMLLNEAIQLQEKAVGLKKKQASGA